jgi:hypothetical protein
MKNTIASILILISATGCAANSKTFFITPVITSSINSTIISGVVVDVIPIPETLYTPVRNKTCINTQVPVYGNTSASNGIIAVTAFITNIVSPGNTAVAVSNGSAITERVTGYTVTELTNQNNIVGYRTVPECRIVESVIQSTVINSYRVVIRVGEQDLMFITTKQYYISQDVSIDVNRNLL